jgi:hypothetical protein
VSSRKISARRRSDFKGSRRSIPALNQQKRELRALLESEWALFEQLLTDAHVRRAFERGMGLPSQPFSVWHDSDHSWHHTEISGKHLPRWEELSEAATIFAGYDAARETGAAYTFTSHIEPVLLARWSQGTRGLVANVEQRLRRALKTQGIGKAAFCFVVETRARAGRSSTRPHLHGILIADDPLDATRFQSALYDALVPSMRKQGRARAVMVKRAFDSCDEIQGRSVWPRYIVKNAQRWDARLGKRRVFRSRTFVEIAREAWQLRRGE